VGAGIRPADLARPTHLPAHAALPKLSRTARLRLLPLGRAHRRRAAHEASDDRQQSESEMTRHAFRQLVEEAIDTIPRRFARHVRNVAIVIEDEPSAELLSEAGLDPGDTLLGLYQGTPLVERGWNHGNAVPT
jgi:hypothetical protein